MRTVLASFLFLLAASCFAQNFARPNITAPKGLSINSFTGNLFYQRTDLTLRGVGFPVYGAFYYNTASDSIDYGYGYGWSFYYNMYYVDKGSSVLIYHGDAKSDSFYLSGGVYKSPASVYDKLAKTTGGYVLTTKDGTSYSFLDASHKKLTRLSDPNNNFIDLTYQGGLPVKLINSSGRTMQLNWVNGSLESLYDNDMPAKKYSYKYDSEKRLTSVTNPLNGKINYEYTGHDLVRLTDENNSPVVIQYNQSGIVKSIISCNSDIGFQIVSNSASFASSGQSSDAFITLSRKAFVTRTSSAGTILFVYNYVLGENLTSISDEANKMMKFTYDNNNNLITSTDWKGQPTGYTYDAKGNVLSQTDPMGYKSSYTYEAVYNKIASVKDKKGNTTSFNYDSKGNLKSVAKPGAVTESYDYNSNGTLKTFTNANGKITSYDYNTNGDLIQTTYPIGIQQFEYSGSCCNLSKVTDANGNTISMTYDLMNRVKTVTDKLNNTLQYDYDAAGNLLNETDPNGNVKHYTYDALNRLAGVTLPSAGNWHYEYDGADNLTKLTDANGHSTSYQYDKKNRLVRETDPIGNSTTYAYDDNDNLVSKTYPNGNITNYKYDEVNRLTEKTYPGNSDQYSYDAAGNLASSFNNNITYTFEYDNLNRLLKKNIPTWGKSISYTYDNMNNRKSMTDHDGGLYSYDYDDNNRLTALKNSFNLTTNFEYDLGGRLTKQINANNTYTTYAYDNGGRLERIENKRTNNEMISNFYYTFDKLGNRKTLQDKRGFNTYNYDASYRLTDVQYADGSTENFKIDPTGNRTERTKNSVVTPYTYNSADQIQTAGSSSFNFDANGNTILQNDSIQRVYAYDGENRLIHATLNANKNVGWYYDPLGNKIQKVNTNGILTKMIYDGDNLLSELNSSNYTLTKYTTALGVDTWITMNTSGTNYFYQKDGLNSTAELTGSYGQLENEYIYDVYGNLLLQSESVTNSVQYTGRLWDKDIGLYDYRSRFYQSSYGRFLNKDKYNSINFFIPKLSNSYAYVENNPLNLIDPKGEFGIIGAVIGGGYEYWTQRYNNEETCVQRILTEGALGALDVKIFSWFFKFPELPIKNSLIDLFNSLRRKKFFYADGPSVPGYTTSNYAMGAGIIAIPYIGNKLSEDVVDDFLYANVPYLNCNKPKNKNGNDKRRDPIVDLLKRFYIFIVTALDPNEIIGSSGYAEKQWVSSKTQLPYKILFTNNDSLATAPAQKVTVYLPIDQKLNPNSLRLGDFGFGKFNFTVPPNSATYSKRLDVKDSLGIYVDVTAGLDIPNRLAFWIFESIDPATGVATSLHPNAGFLPVNDSATHNGEGYVTFTLQPAASAKTGDSVTATATIIFDQEQPLATNTWVNTIDAGAPVSSVSVLPPNVSANFPITWSGTDDSLGSGIQYYDIYYSKNNGSYILLRDKIDSTGINFPGGDVGATYSFFSIATDHTGNREPDKTSGESTATVASPFASICPGTSIIFSVPAGINGTTYQWQLDAGPGFANITDNALYSGVASNLLTLTGVPSSWYGYQYRCIITNGTTSTNSSPVILKFSNTWKGTVSSEWENGANWSCNSLPDENTDVIIGSNAPRNPSLKSNAVCRSLTLSNGAVFTVQSGYNLEIKGK